MHEIPATHAQRILPARILIVDADSGTLETLSDSVTGLGHTVCHAAAPGRPALDLLAGASPDLALIGIGAGDVAEAAIETAEQVVKRFGVPIVYATDTTDAVLLERAQRTNPRGFVLKPAAPQQLDLAIRAALNAAAQEATSGDRNSALYKSLFDSMTEAVIVADTQGRIVALNPAARQVVGTATDRDPNLWPDFFDVYQADGRTPLGTEQRLIARAVRGETTSDLVFVLRPREGNTEEVRIAASGYPLLDDDGHSLGGAVVLRSATDAAEQSARAKRFEAELHERVQVLDAIIRSMGDGVVVADAQERLTLFNPSAERILGLGVTGGPPAEWPEFYGIFYPDTSTQVPADQLPVVRAVQGETTEDQQLFIRNPRVPDGVYISVNASPVVDESQNVVGGVAVFRDVSERRMEEEALAQAFAHGRLEVIDTVLHNIGNAINSVATGVDTLHGRYEDNELIRRFNVLANLVGKHDHDWTAWLADDAQGRQVRPFLLSLVRDLNGEQEELRKTASRVRDRVRHIVDIIRTQASFTDGTVERKTINLHRTINDAVRVVKESLGRRGVTIEVDCTRAPDEILVQESRFQQMLVNLLKNAMEAIDERAARPENDPDWQPGIRLLAYRGERENTVVIDVIDNGIGIDPSRFRSVFNAGYTTKKSGSGLGLHSAANFVIGSGGSIRPLSDGIGRGATMRVMLRLAEPEQQQTEVWNQ